MVEELIDQALALVAICFKRVLSNRLTLRLEAVMRVMTGMTEIALQSQSH